MARSIKHWTMADLQFLRENFGRTMTSRQLAIHFGVSLSAMTGTLKRHCIYSGRDTKFKKGNRSWNKGKSVRLSPTSEFPKGHLPHNTKHDGAISIRKDKTGRVYKYIRIAKGKWELLHREIWKQHHGEIPKTMIVTFIDGDSLNCSLENLKLISRRENAIRNHNRDKAKETMRKIWQSERIRKKYGLSPKTGLGRRIKNAA